MIDDRSTRTPGSPCPKCGKLLDAATKVRGDRGPPEPGDITVCIYCSCFCKFGSDLTLAKLEREEFLTLPVNLQVYLLRAAELAYQMRKRDPGLFNRETT